jgi:hypothetical protein
VRANVPPAVTHRNAIDRLTELVDELLSAHCDTVCLAEPLGSDPDWAAHADYLRGLQRIGQQTLAQLAGLS